MLSPGASNVFTKLAPQKVRHSSGFTVQVADRGTLEYLDGDCDVLVDADFGTTVGIYANSLRLKEGSRSSMPLTPNERELILNRILAGAQALGVQPELL